MQSYLPIYKGKAETVLFKLNLCLWICRDSKILKSVILLDIPIKVIILYFEFYLIFFVYK